MTHRPTDRRGIQVNEISTSSSPSPSRCGLACAVAGAVALVLGAFPAPPVAAQEAGRILAAEYEPPPARSNPFPLTIRSIMRGSELVGQSPSGVRWSDDSEWVYFRWLPGGHEWHEDARWWKVAASGGKPVEVSDAEADSLGFYAGGGDLSDDGRHRLVSQGGDLFLLDRREMELRRLTRTTAGEGSPLFSEDGTEVLFEMGDNLYAMALDATSIRQLTDIRDGSPPSERDDEAEGQRAFLQDQQEELFEYIRRMREEREAARAEDDDEAEETEAPVPVYAPRGARIGGLTPTRDGAFVAMSAFESSQGSRNTIVPRWVTESGYTEDINTRSKVGDAQGSSRVGVLETKTGDVTWIDVHDAVPGEVTNRLGERPAFGSVSFRGWDDSGRHGLVFATSEDYEYRALLAYDAETGETRLLDLLHDTAWVAGPCFGCVGWIPETERAWFVSEESGFAQLYAVNADGTGKARLTDGDWEVQSVSIPESDPTHFLLESNEESPFDTNLYRMELDGSRRRRITGGYGDYDATVSPDGERIAIVHSRSNQPPELYLMDNEPGADMERITTSPTTEWSAFPWLDPEIVRFTAEDGISVPARIYRPGDLGAEPNGAAVVFVHGAGYLQNVHHKWSSYYREYMFHHFLASAGYTVLDIDYRASSGYGRDWRTAIYRWMGGKDLSDQVDGARWLVANEGIDPERIGIYGGSYGGFITLMAMFNAPETFTAGAALRSVTDWAHYNHGYTARILNEPQEDPEAYRQSSPIYFAEGLEGHLLIAHGMVDTNVHFSDVVRLAQRLIELGKEDWEMAVYPIEGHGFSEPDSWTDEYRRIFELFDRVIGEGVVAEPVGGSR